MKTHDSVGGFNGFGSAEPAVPIRGANNAKHRGRKTKKHGKGGQAKKRRK